MEGEIEYYQRKANEILAGKKLRNTPLNRLIDLCIEESQDIRTHDYETIRLIFIKKNNGEYEITRKASMTGNEKECYFDDSKLKFRKDEIGVVILHNHPNGALFPSDDDDALTKTVKDSTEKAGRKLFDHIILHNELFGTFSFKREKRIL